MKNKKLIAFISAVCMSLTAVPSVVFADEDIPDYSVETIVDSGDEPGVNADAGMDAGEDTEVLEEQPITDYDIESDGDVYAATIPWPATTGIKTYCKSTGNDTPVYQTPTSTNGKYGTIYSTDLITIIGYDKSSKRYKVSYPKTGTNTSKTGYVAASNITSATYNVAQSKTKATAKITTYRRSDGKLELGYISKNDTYYVIAKSGNYKQVIYPISGGYKMGWIKTTTSNPTPTTAPISSSGKIGHARNSKLSNADQVSITPVSYFTDWTIVLRPKDTTIASDMVKTCKAGCANNKIQYSQGKRLTLNNAAKNVNYDLSKISKTVYCDCSSFMAVCAIAAGVDVSPDVTTSNMKSEFVKTGKFETVQVNKTSSLKKGDILLKPGSHTAMVVE